MASSIRLDGIPATTRIGPGERRQMTLTVTNASDLVDRYALALSGLEEGWYTLTSSEVSLFPGASASVELTLHPPEGTSTLAGEYPFRVEAISQANPAWRAAAQGELQIPRLGMASMETRPLRAEGKRAGFRVIWRNQSNAPINIELAVRDAEDGLQVLLDPEGPVPVPPGEERSVEATVWPRHKETVGAPHPYELEFLGLRPGSEDLLEPGLKRYGQFTYVPPIRALALPRWLRRLPGWALLALLLLLLALLFLAGRSVGHAVARSSPPSPTRTIAATAAIQRPTTVPATAIPTPAPPARITNFGIQIDPKGGAHLAWQVQGATKVTLDDRVVGASGQIPIQVKTPRVFVLSAISGAGTVARLLQVVPPSLKPLNLALPAQHLGLPVIRRFAVLADPHADALSLVWQTEGADRRFLNNQPVASSGSRALAMDGSRTYLLRAVNGAGTTAMLATLPPIPQPLARTVSLHLPSISLFTLRHPRDGQPYTLVWRTTNAASVTLNGAAVPSSGSMVPPLPLVSKRYLLVARNGNGQVTGQVRVVVQ